MFEEDSIGFASAGTHAISGHPATDTMQQVAANVDLDLSHHKATPLSECVPPDLVLGMEQHHLVAARSQFPALDASRIRLLDHPNAVVDPYGMDLDTYMETAAHVMEALRSLDLDSLR